MGHIFRPLTLQGLVFRDLMIYRTNHGRCKDKEGLLLVAGVRGRFHGVHLSGTPFIQNALRPARDSQKEPIETPGSDPGISIRGSP